MDVLEFKKLTNWQKVRALSGIIPQSGDTAEDNKLLIHRLAIICLISRVEAGDASETILNTVIEKMFGTNKEEE
jgi:hypothetical protein